MMKPRLNKELLRCPFCGSKVGEAEGIGGFPLVFSRCGATPVWASEIEEFPIAVTKKRFPEE